MKETVVVGMSGGVDSSVAAYLLNEQGYRVIGVTMQLWQDNKREGSCCGLSAVEDARRVAQMLDIPYYVMNFQEDFYRCVITDFIKEYHKGRTPNPCIACNRYIKWEALLKRSIQIGADYIATGHYACIEKLPNGRIAVREAALGRKDQSYALYSLTQEQLSRTLMPVGVYEKTQIRAMAAHIGLTVAAKPDSQEICFVPDRDYAGFIERESGNHEANGNFVTAKGVVLGKHSGISHYTIGQRRGLGLSVGEPAYVTAIRPLKNEVVVGKESDLLTTDLMANAICYMGAASFEPGQRFQAKIRYSHHGEMCTVLESGDDFVRIRFDEPVRAVTPGQAVVFYENRYILGGGTIC